MLWREVSRWKTAGEEAYCSEGNTIPRAVLHLKDSQLFDLIQFCFIFLAIIHEKSTAGYLHCKTETEQK